MIGEGARVRILPTEDEGALREGAVRVKLPAFGTVVKVAGVAHGYSTCVVYVDGLKATRLLKRERLEPASLVDILGALDG